MPAILVVVSPRDFRDEELFVPLETWRPTLDVFVTSTRRGAARGMAGGVVEIRRAVAELAPYRFDGVAVIGGTGAPRHLWDSPPVRNAVAAVARSGGLLAAICYGVVVLARAGVLVDRRAIGYPDPLVDIELQRGGAQITRCDVVVDSRVVSANGPRAAAGFGRAVLSSFTAPVR